MTTAEIVKTVAEAFDISDHETILNHMAYDVQWLMLGGSIISGKEDLQKFFADHPDTKILSITKDHFLVDGNTAVIDGQVRYTDESGNICDMFYCDIYELESSKIKKLTSYMVNKK